MQVAIQLGSSGVGGLSALGVGLRLYKRSRIRGVAGGCAVRGRLPRQHDTVTARLGRAAGTERGATRLCWAAEEQLQ